MMHIYLLHKKSSNKGRHFLNAGLHCISLLKEENDKGEKPKRNWSSLLTIVYKRASKKRSVPLILTHLIYLLSHKSFKTRYILRKSCILSSLLEKTIILLVEARKTLPSQEAKYNSHHKLYFWKALTEKYELKELEKNFSNNSFYWSNIWRYTLHIYLDIRRSSRR